MQATSERWDGSMSKHRRLSVDACGTFSGMGGQFAATNAQEEAILQYGRRLLRLSKVAGIRIDHISQDATESIVFERP
jgi:hypothetical protein